MQNLATTDIVDLMLNTRMPVDRIVDWIDQASTSASRTSTNATGCEATAFAP